MPFQKAAEFRFVLAIVHYPKKGSWKIWPFCIDLSRSQHVWPSFAAMFVVRPGTREEIYPPWNQQLLRPWKIGPKPKKERIIFQPSFVSGANLLLVSGRVLFFVEQTWDDDHLRVDFADAKPIMAFGIFVAPLAHSSWARYPSHSTSKQHQRYYCPLMEETIGCSPTERM